MTIAFTGSIDDRNARTRRGEQYAAGPAPERLRWDNLDGTDIAENRPAAGRIERLA